MPHSGVSVPRDEEHRPWLGAAVAPGDDVRLPPGRGGGVPGRRTVAIRGRGSERYNPEAGRGTRPSSAARRPSVRPYERAGFRPDKVAMWAVLLGVLLVLVAATSSHAAVDHVHALVSLAR